MSGNKILLAAQLINSMNEQVLVLEKDYQNSEKEKFENHKSAILDLQKKINLLLSEKI